MATMDNVTGNRMRLLRIERRMTQEEVGQHLGVSKATINKYELGTTQNLSRAKIQALATLFEVSPAYLMGWTNARDGSDLFTTYPPDQIFPQAARVSYPGLRPDNTMPRPEARVDRLEVELVRIFHELSMRNQTRLLSTAYDLQDSERALSRERLTASAPLPAAEELEKEKK